MPPLFTTSDLKTFLGLTGTQDDATLSSIASNASSMLERRTGRVFSYQSNITYVYSLDGQAAITVHDRPTTDATRTVLLDGVTLTEGSDYWMLPDRRNPEISTTIQVRYFDRSRPDWYKASPSWFDRNLDQPDYRRTTMTPNALSIAGAIGHANLPPDVSEAALTYGAFLYWRRKSGASGFVQLPNGAQLDLTSEPDVVRQCIEDWRIRTSVTAV